MYKTLGITALATLAIGAISIAAETAVSITAPGLNVGSADAADFTGRIKRIRIKKRRVGEGFKLSTQTTGNGSSETEVASAKAVLTDANGSTIETVTLGTAFHGTVVASTTTTDAEMGDSITITLAGDDSVESQVTVALKNGKGQGTNDDGWKAKATLNAQGTLRVVVMNEDRDWDGAALTSVSVTGENSASALSMDLTGNDKSLQATLSTDLDTYSTVTATITLFDADGVEIESASQDFEFDGTDALEDAPLDSIDIESTEKGISLTTWTVNDGSDLALEVDLTDAETGKSVLMTVDDTPMLNQQSYALGPIAFKDAPDGSTYALTVDGLVLGGVPQWSMDSKVTMPKYASGSETSSYQVFEDLSGAVGFVQDDTGIYLHVIYEGEKPVDGIAITVATVDGPVPIDVDYKEIDMEMVGSWSKWVQSSETALPELWEVTVTVTTADGEQVQTSTTTGSGDGSVYEAAAAERGVFPTSLISQVEALAGI